MALKRDDIAALMKGIAPVIAELVEQSAQPLLDRIEALERHAGIEPQKALPKPRIRVPARSE